MQSDTAVTKIEDDKFGRFSFAEILAKALQLPEGSDGLVVALEGEWGTGKTVILNFVEQFIKQQNKDALVVRFDPWLISGLDTLCQGYLVQLAAALTNSPRTDITNKAAKRVLNLAKFLGPIKLIPGAEPWGTIVENVISSVGNSALAVANIAELDLNKRKNDLEDSIKELNVPIIVIIDDIDRLRPEEVRTVFQLVKAVGNFKRVSYLLAYDPDPIYKALEANGISDGKEYLEKIVQVPYRIPKLRYFQKKRHLDEMLRAFIARYGLQCVGREQELIQEALSGGGVTHAIRHPRDINRLINKLRISAVVTKDEVCFADIVVFETLAMVYPHVAEAITKRPFDFIKANPEEDLLMGDYDFFEKEIGGTPATQQPEWKRKLFQPVADTEKNILSSLLGFLFPGFNAWHTSHVSQNPEAELRICAPGPLMKLLSIGQAEGIPSASEVKAFLRFRRGRREVIDGVIEDDMSAMWFDALFCHVEGTIPEYPEELCEVSFYAVVTEHSLRNNKIVNHAAKFLKEMLRSIGEETKKFDLFGKIASNAKCLTLAHDVIFEAVKEHGMWIRKQGEKISSEKMLIQTWDVVEQGQLAWLKAVKTKAQDYDEFFKEPGVLSILHRWGQFNNDDYTEVQHFVDNLTSTEAGMQKFMELWASGVGVTDVDSLIGDKEKFIERMVRHPNSTLFNQELVQYVSPTHKG